MIIAGTTTEGLYRVTVEPGDPENVHSTHVLVTKATVWNGSLFCYGCGCYAHCEHIAAVHAWLNDAPV